MKPVLLIGLGNTLMGDDGVGCVVAERLSGHPRLPPQVEVMSAGTDLLACAAHIEGRRRVVLVDAIQAGGEPGGVTRFEDLSELEQGQDHVHHLSVVQAARLLQMAGGPTFVLIGVAVRSAEVSMELSPALSERLPAILESVLAELAEPAEN